MEELEKLRNWLITFPLWGGADLVIDTTGADPGACGLFPTGVEEVSAKEDVLGNRTVSYRQQFLLRRVALRNEDAAAWLLALQRFVNESNNAPGFGDGQSRIRAEKGRLISASQSGTGTYEVRLTSEFERFFEGE